VAESRGGRREAANGLGWELTKPTAGEGGSGGEEEVVATPNQLLLPTEKGRGEDGLRFSGDHSRQLQIGRRSSGPNPWASFPVHTGI
jgi:hypothetical protein